ncbi:adenine nucleotide alpha hydrolases-like protein [Piedraia hortae CBS 480.64]|uniref:Diphthine--ammonia ligase n=1 Tax=Piedraia hortae CBS 480.64 TaxID=1314780 RepID=A0A6A7BVS5_9PEZI|nr:adenine nucleotide alpha hydrolases-like protein [Piedraia hortae CBS 480.64]
MPFKVVALISGGKDSFFSLLHTLANGHEVVALANLHPPEEAEEEDMNSYMYQTVGHGVIPLYSRALGLPLYRQVIKGTAVHTGRDYPDPSLSKAEEDETESLIPLLTKVHANHPEINALCTGAIFSTYQRTRVENVARRMGLVSLAWLWHYPFLPSDQPNSNASLLHDLSHAGLDARIIKLASGSLPASLLWSSVSDTRIINQLTTETRKFSGEAGAVLGEGGEYETLVIRGPAPTWKFDISVTNIQACIPEGGGGISRVKVHEPRLIPKQNPKTGTVRKISLWDKKFHEIIKSIEDVVTFPEPIPQDPPLQGHILEVHTSRDTALPAAEQLREIFSRIHFVDAIVQIILILRNMSLLLSLEPVLEDVFPTSPPTRITFANSEHLPPGCEVGVYLPSATNSSREALQIHSRSYWAPAAEGWFSQSVTTTRPGGEGKTIYLSACTGLIPRTMRLIEGSFAREAALALQNSLRVGKGVGLKTPTAGAVFLIDGKEEGLCGFIWKEAFSASQFQKESENFDIWDLKYNSHKRIFGGVFAEEEEGGIVPPLWVIKVSSLPNNARVSWSIWGGTDPDWNVIKTLVSTTLSS